MRRVKLLGSLLYGTATKGFDPRTAKDSECILVWGANPSHSAPHAHTHWLKEAPAKVVVVDPIRTRTAEQADLHLQPRPGTDAALAFAILHVLREQGAFDEAFIARHTVGADEINHLIDPCTPEWAEGQTGVPAADIRRAAQLYGAGPSLLWVGQSLSRQPQGGNIMRSVGLLPALTGNVGKPGAGFYYLNYTHEFAGIDDDYLAGAHLATAEPKSVGAMDLAQRLMDPDAFKAFIVCGSNPLASGADQQKLREACAREDLFTVVIDCFETDTARYADIVLPAASFLEFDDITLSYFNLTMGAQSKVRALIGEALPNQEIFRRIAGAMGFDDPALFESDEEMIAKCLDQMGRDYDFAELQRLGHFFVGGETPQIFFEDLAFDTPSGKIELASDAAAEMGLPRTPEPRTDSPPTEGYLRLLSPASNWRVNDSYANDPKLEKRAGPAELILHAEDASRLGVAHGAKVKVSNDMDSIELVAQISNIAQPGTAVSYKGRWPSLEPSGINVNALHAPNKSDMGEASCVHGIEVRVEAV